MVSFICDPRAGNALFRRRTLAATKDQLSQDNLSDLSEEVEDSRKEERNPVAEKMPLVQKIMHKIITGMARFGEMREGIKTNSTTSVHIRFRAICEFNVKLSFATKAHHRNYSTLTFTTHTSFSGFPPLPPPLSIAHPSCRRVLQSSQHYRRFSAIHQEEGHLSHFLPHGACT